jgi:hypothetical protein
MKQHPYSAEVELHSTHAQEPERASDSTAPTPKSQRAAGWDQRDSDPA